MSKHRNTHEGKIRPPNTPSCHPHSAQRQLPRRRTVVPDTGTWDHTTGARGTPRPTPPSDGAAPKKSLTGTWYRTGTWEGNDFTAGDFRTISGG